jgi:hypothetical protein
MTLLAWDAPKKMSPIVTFLSLVSHWHNLLEGRERSDYRKAVYASWQERERIESWTRRFSKALHAKQQSLSQRVADFSTRCKDDPRIRDNNDFLSMTAHVRHQAFEKTVTGAALVMRNQLPLEQRREVRELTVDWSDPRGTAQWKITDDGESGFTIQNAIQYAAEEIAGMDEELAIVVAERLTAEFRRGTMELTGLVKTAESENGATYEWKTGSVSLEEESAGVGRAAEVGHQELETPLLVWLRDERAHTAGELRALLKARPAPRIWEESSQLLHDPTMWIDPKILDDVTRFVDDCVTYSGEQRRAIAQDVALTAYMHLVRAVADHRKDVLQKQLEEEAIQGRLAALVRATSSAPERGRMAARAQEEYAIQSSSAAH